jgi:hypothetical protein
VETKVPEGGAKVSISETHYLTLMGGMPSGKSEVAVKKAVKNAGVSRKRVDRELGR